MSQIVDDWKSEYARQYIVPTRAEHPLPLVKKLDIPEEEKPKNIYAFNLQYVISKL